MSGASELMRAYMRANEGKSHEWGNLGTMRVLMDRSVDYWTGQ